MYSEQHKIPNNGYIIQLHDDSSRLLYNRLGFSQSKKHYSLTENNSEGVMVSHHERFEAKLISEHYQFSQFSESHKLLHKKRKDFL